MKIKMYAIYDSAAGAYLQPFFFHQDGLALRAISDCVADPSHNFAKHPDDYTLFYIGEFDDQTGDIVPAVPAESLGNLIEFKQES